MASMRAGSDGMRVQSPVDDAALAARSYLRTTQGPGIIAG
jgi:hypothetical protein